MSVAGPVMVVVAGGRARQFWDIRLLPRIGEIDLSWPPLESAERLNRTMESRRWSR
jgi:hypothetical protein